MTNRQLQAEETKRKIFYATMTLLQKCDAEDIKIMDIVEAANVSVGSFYNHYSSKKEVFAESYKLEDSYFEEVVEPQLIQEDVRDKLRFFFDQYAIYNSKIANIGRLRYVLSCNNIYVERSYDTGTLGVLQRIIQWGVDNHQLRLDESMICMVAYCPKATVQAAIGSIPLSMGLACGNLVLTVAVLSILITAPLGAFAIDLLYPRLLQQQTGGGDT